MFSPANRNQKFGALVFLGMAVLILLGCGLLLSNAFGLHGQVEAQAFTWAHGLQIAIGLSLAAVFGAIGGVLLQRYQQGSKLPGKLDRSAKLGASVKRVAAEAPAQPVRPLLLILGIVCIALALVSSVIGGLAYRSHQQFLTDSAMLVRVFHSLAKLFGGVGALMLLLHMAGGWAKRK